MSDSPLDKNACESLLSAFVTGVGLEQFEHANWLPNHRTNVPMEELGLSNVVTNGKSIATSWAAVELAHLRGL